MSLAPAVGDDLTALALLHDAIDKTVALAVGDQIDGVPLRRGRAAGPLIGRGDEKAGEKRREEPQPGRLFEFRHLQQHDLCFSVRRRGAAKDFVSMT